MSLRTLKNAAAVSAIAVALAAGPAQAVQVTGGASALDLAEALLPDVGGLSNITAVTSGFASQLGTYTNDSGTYGLPSEGIVLSTGNVADYSDGENSSSSNTTNFGNSASVAQEGLLDEITGGGFDHNDVAQLTITFDAGPDVDSVTFFGVFGSEEFPEFVGSSFIDGFGLFVNGTNIAFANDAPINIDHPDFLGAVASGGEGPIGEVPNDGEFPPIDGPVATAQSVSLEVGEAVETPETFETVIEPGDPRLALVTGTELDGVVAPDGNPVLRFDVPVAAGESNTLDIIIADTTDGSFDSTVYLSSFTPTEIDLNDGGTELTPLLPNDPDPNDGIFEFDLSGIPDLEEIFFIDPPVAVGYTYTVTDAEFKEIQAPSLATVGDLDGYFLDFAGNLSGSPIALAAGETFDISGFNVSEFTLTGIDTSLLLDPNDPLAFPLGISLQNITPGATPTASQQVITENVGAVPLPGGLPLYLGGLLAFAAFRRFRFG